MQHLQRLRMSTTTLLFVIICLSIIINPTSSQGEEVYDATLDFCCGKDWQSAANSCTHNCQSGNDSDCINLLGIGYECFKFTGCKYKIDNDGQVVDEVQEVIDKVEDTIVNAGTSNYCGDSWTDAMLTCGRPCASGGNNECLGDGTCFAATNCQGELQRLIADMLVTLLGSDMQEMQGEDSDVLKYTLSKTLRNIVEDQGVALDDVDLGEQSLITRRELEERYHQRSLIGWHEDGVHMKVNNITQRMLPTGSSALDVSMTISGNYRPPPYIIFGNIVEDSINRQGQKVVSTLRERGSQVGRTYFERVEGIEAQQKGNVTPRPSRKPTQRPTLSPTTFQSMKPSISPSEGIKAEPSSAPSLDHFQEIVTGSQEDLELGGTTTSSYGYIFNVRTKENSGVVMIDGFDFYTESTEDVNFELWTRLGSYSDYKGTYDGWDLIASGTTQGRGLGRYTSIPEETFTPVSIPGGGGETGTRAFYITTDTRDLVYKIGEGTSSDELVQQESEDIEIYQGEGVLFYPFPSSEEAFFYRGPRQYLGTIAYNRLPCSPYSLYGQVLELESDGGCPKVPTTAPTISNEPTVIPPTSSPTLEISTSSPVSSSSAPISSQQESKVTETPTIMNEGNPTLTPTNPKPSASPSTSAPTPSPIVSMKVNIRTLIHNIPARDMTDQEATKLLETLETFLVHNTEETLVIVGLDLWHHKMVSGESIFKSSRGNTRALKSKQEEEISVPSVKITYIVRISVARVFPLNYLAT